MKTSTTQFSVLGLAMMASLSVTIHSFASVGAFTPFVSYEAELGVLGGGATVVYLTSPPTTEFSSPQLEASGHAYVHLAGDGQSVRFTNTTGQSISALNIRYSIPDSAAGGGITNTLDLYVDGTLKGAITVNSFQTWVYETSSDYNGMSQSPSAGNPHVFWDEVSLFVPGGSIPNGGTFTLQMDSANTAAYYNIDVIDLETPPPALTKPAKSLSITSYGGTPNNPSFDNTTAILDCAAAAISAGDSVWIPSGVWYVNAQSSIKPGAVTVGGAGPWYTTVQYVSAKWTNGIIFHGNSTSFENLTINCPVNDSNPTLFAILAGGGNWTITNVWARHCMLVWGSGTNASVVNSRVNNSWGDGMNINNTQGQLCTNIVVSNNFSRGNGDDAIAINSQESSEAPVQDVTMVNNTTVASWWANQMAVYGSYHVVIANNLLKDCVKKQGLEINGTGFGAVGSYDVTATNNTLLRTGSYGYAIDEPGIQMNGDGTNLIVDYNTVIDSMFYGAEISGGYNLNFDSNYFTGPGSTGIYIVSGAFGTGTIDDNSVGDLASGKSAYMNNASSTFTASLSSNSWQGIPPSAPASLTPTAESDSSIKVDWSSVAGAASYDMLQGTVNGGPYTTVASGLTGGSYTNTGLSADTTYYFVVTAVNASGQSGYSPQVSATTMNVALTPPQFSFSVAGGQLNLAWPQDHTGWSLQAQTNALGTNWATIPSSTRTNEMTFPIDLTNGSVFFRLVYP